MTVWEQLEVDQAHKCYLITGLFSTIFCLISLLMKEKLFIGEAIISTLVGSVFGPHVFNFVNPTQWGDIDYITKEVSRLVLIIQIFAISVELPRKYMKYNYPSVLVLLCFTMILGWLLTGAFAYLIFPGFTFTDGLAITGAITATDPVLAAAIIGKGKFGERVPAYLRHLISAESGANDGLAFPFVLLAVNLLVHSGQHGTIAKDFILVAVLYECVFGIMLGIIIGYTGRQAIQFCENKNYIDKESFLIFYIFLSLICTGFGSIIGVDDLLVSFAAGSAFAWNGWFAAKIEGQHLSNSIDLLLNVGYFLYFGAVIPWGEFNNGDLGLNFWRLVVFGVVIVFLRRIPAVLMSKPFVPAFTNWGEAFFVGHFGPIGVGGIFCAMITKDAILKKAGIRSIEDVTEDSPYYKVLHSIWPIVSSLVVTSIIVHGFSVTFIILSSKIGSGRVARANPLSKLSRKKNDVKLETIEIPSHKKENETDESLSQYSHNRKVFLGNYQQEELKFYKIGQDVVVETMNEEFVKKYRINHGKCDEESGDNKDFKLLPLVDSDLAINYDDSQLREAVRTFLLEK